MITAKIIAFLLRLFHRGATTLPGRAALKIKPDILKTLSKGVRIICVTGTNGKTTTCALLEHVMKEKGCSYFINKSGANMITGVTTSFIMNSTLFGKCKKEYAILECDENSFVRISEYIDAEVTIVTNLFRDQLDRYGEVSSTLSKIKQSIDNMKNTVLVLNGDCPMTFSLSRQCPNRYVTFGINASYSSDMISDIRYCPNCAGELHYKSRIFSSLGDFYCPHCGYQRRTPDCYAGDLYSSPDLGNSFVLHLNKTAKFVSSSLGGIYNVYNFCAAAAALHLIGIDAPDTLCTFSGAFGRMERFSSNGKTVLLLLVKNPVGLSNCIKYVCRIKTPFDVAFALNDNEADSTDVSWIWDSDFTPLGIRNPKICTLGKRSLDMALRLKYDDLTVSEIIDGEDYGALLKIIRSGRNDFVIFSTYTAMMHMRKHLIHEFGGEQFWK